MFGDNLKRFRTSEGLSQAKLASRLSVSQQTVASWEVNRTSPAPETVVVIAEALGISPNQLLGQSNPKAISIPVLDAIPAGIPMEAIEDILNYEEVPPDWGRDGKEYFALKLKGDSMSPRYLPGDVVIFQKADDCESGDRCAVIINGEDATFKKVIKHSSGVVLQPLNATYEPIFYSNNDVADLPVRVIGVAKETRRKE